MTPDTLIDLLPLERRRALARDYFLRLGAVALLFAVALVLTAALLLVPTYVFLAKSSGAKQARLASMESTLSSFDDAALSARLSALKSNTSALAALARAPSASATARSTLAISRPGITLSGFEYVPTTGARPGTIIVSGIAATRDALRGYQLALERAPFVRSADLPVSTYAKDRNIPFTITVILTP